MIASMINYILSHKCNKKLKDTTFSRMNEVECMFHSTPQVKWVLWKLTVWYIWFFRDIINASDTGSLIIWSLESMLGVWKQIARKSEQFFKGLRIFLFPPGQTKLWSSSVVGCPSVSILPRLTNQSQNTWLQPQTDTSGFTSWLSSSTLVTLSKTSHSLLLYNILIPILFKILKQKHLLVIR